MKTKTLLALGCLTLLAGAPAAAVDKAEIQVYPSAGTATYFAVRGRVLMESAERGSGRSNTSRNLKRLFGNEEWPYAPVRAKVGAQVVEGKADGEGLFDLEFRLPPEAALPPGEHAVTVEVPGQLKGSGLLRVLAKGQLLVVSDFDDTVAITNVTSKRRMLAAALLENEHSQAPAPGMAEFYQCLKEGPGQGRPGAAFIYLSGSPIQYQARIAAFLDKRGFPPGALVLRHLADAGDGPEAFKDPQLKRILDGFPDAKLLLVGDSGEKDPEVYAKARGAAGERVLGTFIRLVTAEARNAPRFKDAKAFASAGEAARAAVDLGLVTRECAAKVEFVAPSAP